ILPSAKCTTANSGKKLKNAMLALRPTGLVIFLPLLKTISPPINKPTPAMSMANPTTNRANPKARDMLRHDLPHHAPVHVGQAEIAAGVTVREALVVEAEQPQDRGVQIVD